MINIWYNSIYSGHYYILPHSARLPIRIVTGLWFLTVVIITTSYSSNITAYLTIPKLEPIVNSYEELAASQQYTIMTWARSSMADLFLV